MTAEEILQTHSDNRPKVYSHVQATEAMKDYAHLQIEKDRERVINEADGWFNRTDIISLQNKTPIILD